MKILFGVDRLAVQHTQGNRGIAHKNKLTESRKKMLLYTILSISAFLFILPAQLNPSNFFQDDSYFYPQVAHNILQGNGSTFHGITPTNGYHPLWMLFSVLSLFLAGNDKIFGLNVILGLQALLFLGTAYFFHRITRLISNRWWLAGIAILATYFFSMGTYGSEAHLNAFMVVLSTYYFLRTFNDDTLSNWVKAGIFSGFAVLARLDNIFVVGSLFLLGLLNHQHWNGKMTLRKMAILGFSFSCVVAPYLLYNFIEYGHLVPISGAIKSTFPEVTGNLDNLGKFGKITLPFALASVLLSFYPGLTRLQRTLLQVYGVGTFLHAGYVVLFTDHYTFWPWYYVTGVLNLAFLSVIVLQRGLSFIEKYTTDRVITSFGNLIMIFLVLAGLIRGWAKAYNPDNIGPFEVPKINAYRWPDEVAIWMKDNLPARSRVFVYDWPGAIAYYSDLQIIPMDGLVNDFQYNDDISSQDINHYLCRNNVRFFFGPEKPDAMGPHEFEVMAPLYKTPAGAIQLLDQNLVVSIKNIVQLPEETPRLAIWRIEPCQAVR